MHLKAFDLESKSTEPAAPPKGRQIADNLLKRSNNLVNVVTKALNANSQGEPLYVRLRHEADEADKIYRVGVRKLDRQRLGLEERIEEVLKMLQRWEAERLRAVKTGKLVLPNPGASSHQRLQYFSNIREHWRIYPKHSNPPSSALPPSSPLTSPNLT